MPGIKFGRYPHFVQQTFQKGNFNVQTGNADFGIRLHPYLVKGRCQIIIVRTAAETAHARRIEISLFAGRTKRFHRLSQILNLRQPQTGIADIGHQSLNLIVQSRHINGLNQIIKRKRRLFAELRQQIIAAAFRIRAVQVKRKNGP